MLEIVFFPQENICTQVTWLLIKLDMVISYI